MLRRGILADLILFGFCVLCALHVPVSLVDDAFIAYRYGANAAHGLGLVLTSGQRVEGVSDLSWTLLMAIPAGLHVRPELFAIILGSLSAAVAFIVVRRALVSALEISPAIALSITALAAFNCDYWIMAGNGIESGLFALVLVSALSLVSRNRLFFGGVLLGLATTLRPESLTLAPLTVISAAAIAYWRNRNARTFVDELSRFRPLLQPWAGLVLAVLCWRYFYYGAFVPNTLIAKAHPIHLKDLEDGAIYVARFAARSLPWTILTLAVLIAEAPVPILLGLFWFAFQVFVVMVNSGDWMPGYRLLSVYIPVITLLSAFLFDRWFVRRKIRIWGIAALLVVVCAVQIHDKRWTRTQGILDLNTRAQMLGSEENTFMRIADALRPALKPDDVMAPEILGVFSYMLIDTPMHDFLGLADSHIAHNGNIYLPMYGKAEPVYSVETVSPAAFILVRGDHTVHLFERETAGVFRERYGCWVIANRPERVMLAIRKDREEDFLAAMRNSTLELQPLVLKQPLSSDSPY